MMDNDDAKETAVNHAAKEPMGSSKSKITDYTRQDDSEQESNEEDVAILPSEDFVGLKVFNVLNDFFTLVDHDPAHVCPHESFLHRVRIIFFIGFEMMPSVIAAPFDSRILEGCCTEESIEQTHWPRCFVGAMTEQAVVSCRDRKAASKVKGDEDEWFDP